MDISEKLKKCTGFQWDKGNIEKNWLKHKVSPPECEQIFFNIPLIVHDDIKHSEEENRYYILGKTNANRFLFVVFTLRQKQIRIISARDMNREERRVYRDYEEIHCNLKMKIMKETSGKKQILRNISIGKAKKSSFI
ncbi:MAG: BrnT family toxin [Actinomycetota bacterium]|nr:BrnT family toxin [Actinomycetota bacterium]